ncbi:MAG: hypothetical protein GTN49_09745 [candidate division Zixibacteria bacterium]|nr:hypothetical protein [candidate division Zixibacteria bacterium]
MVTEYKAKLTIEEGEVLAAVKAKNGARRQNGAKILVLVVARADFRHDDPHDDSIKGFNRTVTDYEVLLQDTYGAENVTLRGAGYETFPGLEPRSKGMAKYLQRLDFSGDKFLYQYEFAMLIRSISREKYDQIHIVGHGDPDVGLLFFGGRDLRGDIYAAVGFDEAKAKRAGLNKSENWPMNPGCKIALMACGSAAGDFAGFLTNPDYDIAKVVGDVYTIYGDFLCEGKDVTFGPEEIPEEERPRIGRITLSWYHDKQYRCISALGERLGIQEASAKPR